MRSIIEISKSALINNIDIMRSITTNIFCVLKSNAYGHGLKELIDTLKNQKINAICVAHINEAREAINFLWDQKIIIMAPYLENDSIDFINQNKNIELFIYSFESLFKLISWKNLIKNKIKIHLKIDVGLHRLGFFDSDLEKLVDILKK